MCTPTHDRKNRVFAASNKRNFTRKPLDILVASCRPHSALLNEPIVLLYKMPGTHLILTRENALFQNHAFLFFRNFDLQNLASDPDLRTRPQSPNFPTSPQKSKPIKLLVRRWFTRKKLVVGSENDLMVRNWHF